jgi:hypothetical protein
VVDLIDDFINTTSRPTDAVEEPVNERSTE